MDKDWLAEYQAREENASFQRAQKLLDSASNALLREASPSEVSQSMFPELSDAISGFTGNLYTAATDHFTQAWKIHGQGEAIPKEVYEEVVEAPRPGDRLLRQLPFYDTIFCPVIRFHNQETWESYYGVSVNQFMQLVEEGRVAPFINDEPMDFQGYSYLDPIIQYRPPSWCIRDTDASAAIVYSAIQYDYLDEPAVDEVTQAAPDIGAGLDSLLPASSLREVQMGLALHQDPSHLLSAVLASGPQREELPHLLDRDEVSRTASLMHLHQLSFGLPSLSMGESICLTDQTIQQASSAIGEDSLPHLDVFRADIAARLTDEFSLVDPGVVDFNRSLEVRAATEPAREALRELQAVVERREAEEAVDRAEALDRTLKETNETIEAALPRRDDLRRGLDFALGVTGSMAGTVLGPAGTLLGPALSTISGRLDATDRGADRLIQAGMDSHVAALFRLTTGSGG